MGARCGSWKPNLSPAEQSALKCQVSFLPHPFILPGCFRGLFMSLICVWVFTCICVSVHHVHTVAEEDPLELESHGCEPPCGCWKLNPSPLQEQPVLFTSEPLYSHHDLHSGSSGLKLSRVALFSSLFCGSDKIHSQGSCITGIVWSSQFCGGRNKF